MKWILTSLSSLGVVGAALAASGALRKTPLVVHEWGTITARHAPDGTPRGRLNRIPASDTLPSFVYRFEPPSTRNNTEKTLVKAPLIPGRPDITMRLETPVMYFHVPAGAVVPPFDVNVRFRGGVLNEFYPRGDPSVEVDVERINMKMQARVLPTTWDGQVLDNYVVGGLRWRAVMLRDSVPLARTTSHVWLAPRNVHAADVVTGNGPGERYLFYRGVAHLEALVQTQVTRTDVRLWAPKRLEWLRESAMTIPNLWLVDVRPDGAAAFREQERLELAKNAPSHELGRLARFSADEYSGSKLADLRRSMKRALVAAGLYDDEAEAMLETWGESYYHSPGLRIFYLVPKEWVSYFLPLQISVPHDAVRVLVGRIDLETP